MMKQEPLIPGFEEKVRFHWQLSESNERYTPKEIVDIAKYAFGGLPDLDPASNPAANSWIGAKVFFGIEQDGLSKPWFGNVWLNPPYGKTGNQSNVNLWARKCCEELQIESVQGLAFLCGARHLRLEWVLELMSFDNALTLLFADRIQFLRIPQNRIGNLDNLGMLERMTQPTDNNALIYVGHNPRAFIAAAAAFGIVLQPVKGDR